MLPRRRMAFVFGFVGALSAPVYGPPARADIRPHAGMMRYPDVSATHIVFSYANDLWVAPRAGGVAVPLASPPGPEASPRFSPDGQTIAFMGNYDGNVDLYTIPLAGGVPCRITYHPNVEILCDWTPDGRLLFFSNFQAAMLRQVQLFTVAATGGLPEKLPVPYGANGAISPDGQWLAYTLHTTDNRTWKRYRGGMATDIWLFNLRDHSAKKITDWEGTDSQPMWHGDSIYYMSDEGPSHRLNIWVYDMKTGRRQQITQYADFDIKWPAIGPGPNGQGEIVFQYGADLVLLDLATRQTRVVEIVMPGDRPKLRPQRVDARGFIQSWDLSPTGKRALAQARGDVWTIPAHKGSPRNLTRTSGVAERDPAWSPDGRSIAHFSDATGDYELYVMPADGPTPPSSGRPPSRPSTEAATTSPSSPRQLSHHGPGFLYDPVWSPDSKTIVYTDMAGNLWLCSVEDGETKLVDTDPWAYRGSRSWSSDSTWLAYTKTGESHFGAIWLYNRKTSERHQVTSGLFNDGAPTFDRKGDYLFFGTNRHFDSPVYGDVDGTWVYVGTDVLCVVPLRAKVGSPWAPKSDEETAEKEKSAKDGEDKDKEGEEKKERPTTTQSSQPASKPEDAADEEQEKQEKEEKAESKPAAAAETQKAEPKAVEIELDGFEQRAIPLPIKPGELHQLAVNDQGHLIYVRGAPRGSEGEPSLKIFDLTDEDKKEKAILDGVGSFTISADGKKLLVGKGGTMAVVDARPDQKLDKPMSLDGLAVEIDPREEWQQVFTESWRLMRDFFYVQNMHGVDWPKMRAHYAAMLPDCVTREDVTYVIKELISELNAGHTYYWGEDPDQGPSVSVGLLGVDFDLRDGAYRIARIYAGGPWDLDARGPLSQPGVDVKEGDYLLAVNRVPVDAAKAPWAAFQGLGGRVATLTVSAKPQLDDDAREVVVELRNSEADLRYRAWVEQNRAYVAEKTGGRVGYLHVPNTGGDGQNELFRQFHGQREKPALIIDERWNGGGQIPDRFIELLNRPIFNYWARRYGRDARTPGNGHLGPRCMLINGLAGSGGDAFPAYFKARGLGKLIGTRTWGGLVGISGNPALIDNVFIAVPNIGYYHPDGRWGIEGHGVDPDIEVIDDPARMADGSDPQLDAAIQHMLAEIEMHPYVPPQRPPDPDRSGMGLPANER
jgi:tricorn protease